MTVKWYAAAVVAVAVTAWVLGSGLTASLLIGVVSPLAVLATPRFIAATIAGVRTPSPREDAVAVMSGEEFEDHVARIARSSGAPVMMTSLTGDWGVDIIVGRRPNRLAIQCKRQSRPVGASAVQEVVAGAPMQDCAHTMVVTNHEFTSAARKLAELHGCQLVSGADLPRLRSMIRRALESDEA